jgi:ferritin-like metal-binding protein YciE
MRLDASLLSVMPKQRQQQNDRERHAKQPQQCASAKSHLSLPFSSRFNGIVELLFRPLPLCEFIVNELANRPERAAISGLGPCTHTREAEVAKKPKLLSDMFHDTLKDVYFAENKILKTLPKMAKAAHSKELKAAFQKHEKETRGQVKRLEGVFKILGKPARAKTCDAIMGITKEGAEIMTDYKGMPALDAGLLAAAQAVEHYEISRYGTLRTWAEELGMPDAVALLDATLKEEKATDVALTTIAESVVNISAEQHL